MSSHFTKELTSFFGELEKNNTTAWFNANKKRFEVHVKEPMLKLIAGIIEVMKLKEADITMTPKDALFRMNRDTRFAADKSPYKTSISAAVSVGGRDPHYPGMFVDISSKGVQVILGAYAIEKEQLENLRRHIAENLTELKSIYSAKKFRESFGEIKGEKSKLLPPLLKAAATQEPYIYNKQFYAEARLNSSEVVKETLIKSLADYYHTAYAFNGFLIRGLKL